jgi:hypothetical protein
LSARILPPLESFVPGLSAYVSDTIGSRCALYRLRFRRLSAQVLEPRQPAIQHRLLTPRVRRSNIVSVQVLLHSEKLGNTRSPLIFWSENCRSKIWSTRLRPVSERVFVSNRPQLPHFRRHPRLTSLVCLRTPTFVLFMRTEWRSWSAISSWSRGFVGNITK